MGWESVNMVRFDLGTLLQGQMRIAKHKSAYNSLIIGPRGWNENQPIENHELGIFGVVGFHLGPLLQGQMRIAKLKMLITRLLLVLEVSNGKPTYRKSWAGNLLVWSDLTWDPSFKVN